MSTRRDFLALTAAGAAGVMAKEAWGQSAKLPDVGRKFAADGRVLPFVGNTIVCHVPQQGDGSASFDALLDIYRDLPAKAWTRKMTATPPSSYHMTIFGGANDKERRYPLWPAGIPLDLPMSRCDEIIAGRLRDFRLGADAGPYRMRVNLAEPDAHETPLTIRLLAADQDTEQRLRRVRNRLADVLGIRTPDHDRYRFHITLGYQFAPMLAPEYHAFRHDVRQWKEELAKKAPVITLGNPEFCLLKDMFAFERQFFLR